MPVEGRNEQLVREFFATLSTGDLEALRALIHGLHRKRAELRAAVAVDTQSEDVPRSRKRHPHRAEH
jgi:hypothetical protein